MHFIPVMFNSAVFCFSLYLFLFLNSINGLVSHIKILNGSLTIAGIFEVQAIGNDDNCGKVQAGSVMAVEAVRWYLQSVNDNGTFPFKLGLSMYKTCGLPGRAGDAAVDIISRYRRSNITNAPEDLIIGVLGPEYSIETQTVSSILGSQSQQDQMLQIGFSSTSPELNDRAKYPNYFRVVVDDRVQTQTLLRMMFELKWNRIAILYVNDTNGRADADLLVESASEYRICVSKLNAISIDSKGQVEAAKIREILNGYISDAPNIQGVVYFGDNIIANQVMLAYNSLKVSDVPIFILSKSNLEANVFQSPIGELLPKCKGTLALSVPFIEVGDFKQYWNSLFTSKRALQNASVTNPYLSDVFRQYAGCDINSASCNALDEADANEKVVQSVYVHYAIYAAQTLVEALRSFYATCHGDCGTIDEFRNNFQPNLLIEAMDGLSVSLGDKNASFTKDSPNIQFEDDEKEYEVYNFRRDPDDGNKFKFVNVGYMSGGDLVLETRQIKDYRPDGSEISYPDLRKGQCPVRQKCDECVESDVSAINYHIPGDFYVIGLVAINNQAVPGPLGCGTVRARHGYQMYLSLKYALDEFLTKNWFAQYKDMFLGKKIGLIVINSCNNALEGVPKMLELHSKGLRLLNGTYIDLTNRILGYVGGQAADVSEPVASQLTKLKIVFISFASTNPVLSNKELYPYFLRIVSSDDVQAKAMLAIVNELEGEYIQLVHSEGAYGEGARDAVIAAAAVANICMVQTIEVKESDTYYEYFEMLRRKPHAKIVLVLLRSHVVGPFLRDVNVNMHSGEFQFVGSEAWGKNYEVLQYDITQGAIITALEKDRYRDLDDFIKKQMPEYNVTNPWLDEYIQKRQDCYFSWSYDKTFSRECTEDILPVNDPTFTSDPWSIFLFNTMIAFLKGAATFYNSQCGSSTNNHLCDDFVEHPEEFFSTLIDVKLDIYGTGEILMFDEHGDGLMGYHIYNIQTDRGDTTTRDYALVGSYSPKGGLNFKRKDVEYPRGEPIISSCPSQLACTTCLEDNATSEQSTQSDRNTEVIVLGSLVGILGVVIIALCVAVIVVMRRPQKNPDDAYITPTYLSERPAAEGGHAVSHEENDSSYMTANPTFEHS